MRHDALHTDPAGVAVACSPASPLAEPSSRASSSSGGSSALPAEKRARVSANSFLWSWAALAGLGRQAEPQLHARKPTHSRSRRAPPGQAVATLRCVPPEWAARELDRAPRYTAARWAGSSGSWATQGLTGRNPEFDFFFSFLFSDSSRRRPFGAWKGFRFLAMASEKEAALAAVPNDNPTIFDKIIKKEIPSTVVYEDEKVLAFRDINPQAPTHILLIPKVKDGLTGLSKAEERHVEILGHLLYVAKVVAKQEGLDDGYRVVINEGPSGCQSVYHIHVHLLGGRQMNWPPG
ncbi:hypothetical protein PR202_ga25896 [Eleusine coracana subsp. coracana]|uniref:HIT domain-containing protein n=1 Tax=Eleusine coracana subsp. coracana TaxID=191504 RepID=A0AAV5DBW0_ELECO|nr:hypothetical protein PR202_ga25896 [Eleusine coracana subsp. coracana]